MDSGLPTTPVHGSLNSLAGQFDCLPLHEEKPETPLEPLGVKFLSSVLTRLTHRPSLALDTATWHGCKPLDNSHNSRGGITG